MSETEPGYNPIRRYQVTAKLSAMTDSATARLALNHPTGHITLTYKQAAKLRDFLMYHYPYWAPQSTGGEAE